MGNVMQFQQKAKICTSYGEELGNMSRIVIHPETNVISHIVMSHKKGFFGNEEKVIPIGQIANATGDQIILNDSVVDVERLTPLEEKRRIREDSPAGSGGSVSQVPVDYGMPGAIPAARGPSEGRYITITEHNIPAGAVAVKTGAKVVSAEGKSVGKVQGVLAEVPEDQATHLLVSDRLADDDKKIVPMDWVDWLEDKEVHLVVEKEAINELAGVALERSEE